MNMDLAFSHGLPTKRGQSSLDAHHGGTMKPNNCVVPFIVCSDHEKVIYVVSCCGPQTREPV